MAAFIGRYLCSETVSKNVSTPFPLSISANKDGNLSRDHAGTDKNMETGDIKMETGRANMETGKEKIETAATKIATGKEKVETGRAKDASAGSKDEERESLPAALLSRPSRYDTRRSMAWAYCCAKKGISSAVPAKGPLRACLRSWTLKPAAWINTPGPTASSSRSRP